MAGRMAPSVWLVVLAALAAPGAGVSDSPGSLDATLTIRLAAGKSTYAAGELEFRGRSSRP